MRERGPEEIQGVVAAIIVLCATGLYVISLFSHGANPVEPQSVFTLYGAVLGYLFGRQRGKQAQRESEEE